MQASFWKCVCLVLACVAMVLAAEKPGPQSQTRLGTFEYWNCLLTDNYTAVVNSFNVQPDPMVLPGPLNVSFDVLVRARVHGPLRAHVYLGKKIADGQPWEKLPCKNQIGSCIYPDLCKLLAGIDKCPEPFLAAGIPCKCPFHKNTYRLSGGKFNMTSPAFLPPGEYNLAANLTMGDRFVGCYAGLFTFQ